MNATVLRFSSGTYEMSLLGMGVSGMPVAVCNVIIFMLIGEPALYQALQIFILLV